MPVLHRVACAVPPVQFHTSNIALIKTVNNDLVIVRLTDPLTPVAAVSQEAGTHCSDYFAIVRATLHYSQVLLPPPVFSYFLFSWQYCALLHV